jgi:hypothetical protein
MRASARATCTADHFLLPRAVYIHAGLNLPFRYRASQNSRRYP